jgi:hypothetical protein
MVAIWPRHHLFSGEPIYSPPAKDLVRSALEVPGGLVEANAETPQPEVALRRNPKAAIEYIVFLDCC